MAQRIAHIYGTVRRVEPQSNANATWLRISILSEPGGDTLEVTAFDRSLSEADGTALVGEFVHLTVALEANPGTRGGAFLNCTLVAAEISEPAFGVGVPA